MAVLATPLDQEHSNQMHKLTFHPLGNADSTRIDLENGAKILIDYADMRDSKDPSDKRIDLPSTLRSDLRKAGKDGYEVVVFTHLDRDHINRASEFFEFDHASKYQGDERVKMPMMWVPAAAILETKNEDDARVIQAEAKFRLKRGTGIRIFSSPGMLDEWLKEQGINPTNRAHLITNAGETVQGFSLDEDGVEFFCHSPFATRSEDGKLLDRNKDSIALHITFRSGGTDSRALFLSDLTYDVIADIVRVTEWHAKKDPSRTERLMWDIQKISHHCSYTALSDEKGKDKTIPVPLVDRLFRHYGQRHGVIISNSKPIPTDDSDVQPPHRQAASYYREIASDEFREFKVTMENPNRTSPKPLVLKVDSLGIAIEKAVLVGAGAAAITSSPAPRAGNSDE